MGLILKQILNDYDVVVFIIVYDALAEFHAFFIILYEAFHKNPLQLKVIKIVISPERDLTILKLLLIES